MPAVSPHRNADASAIVTPLISKFHAPAGWTWIIVCDEAAWKRVQVHIDQFDPIVAPTADAAFLLFRLA